MPVSREYLEYIIDQLKAFGPVNARRMFGGAGIYHDGVFFGLVADDTLYFKVDDRSRQDYTDAGMGPFKPFGTYAMSYYEVPADVLEDSDNLKEWATKAVAAAMKRTPLAMKRPSRGRR
jgi:DNA transformation protein